MDRMRGFTLIELMIVVTVIAIIAAIAIPSFNEQVRKSRRSEAMSVLGDLQMRQERWRTNRPTYGSLEDITGTTAALFNNAQRHYSFEVSNVGATAFTLTARPKNAQANDRCGNLVLAVDNAARPGQPPQRSAAQSNCF